MLFLLVDDLKHLTEGFPSNPMGHVQIGLCILTVQRADSAQEFVNSQGLWHKDM